MQSLNGHCAILCHYSRYERCTRVGNIYCMALHFELATQSVTSLDSENLAPLELQDSLTWKILALPYQKYTFSERKFHEEFKYGIQYDIGSGTEILWLKIFGFWGPQKWIFARSISHSPFDPINNSTAYLNSS